MITRRMSQAAEYHLSWDEFHRDTLTLARQLTGTPWQGIIGIARGGMIPATILARELNVRLLDSLCIASYDHTSQSECTVIKSVAGDGEGMLLVDDLVDTGNTLKVALKLLPKAKVAVVYAKPAAAELAQYHSRDFAQDTWIHFPWDLGHAYRPPMVAA